MNSEQTPPTASDHAVVRKRFVVVVCSWFVHHKRFVVREIEAEDEDDANRQGVLLLHEVEGAFEHAAFTIIELHCGEHLPRQLTFLERLTGRLQ